MIRCPCTSSTNLDTFFPNIEFTVGNSQASAKMTMKGSNYMVVNTSTAKCESLIRGNTALDSANYWLMGMPAYRAYTVKHDLTNLMMGFKTSGSAVVVAGIVEGASRAMVGMVIGLASVLSVMM